MASDRCIREATILIGTLQGRGWRGAYCWRWGSHTRDAWHQKLYSSPSTAAGTVEVLPCKRRVRRVAFSSIP